MKCDLSAQLTLSLATLLQGNQVESELIEKALELLCEAAGFNCGLLYELNTAEEFCLMEHYPAASAQASKTLGIQAVGLAAPPLCDKQSIYYMERTAGTTPTETQILNLFSAESLIWATARDDAEALSGFMVLYNTSPSERLGRADLDEIAVPLSLLVRYIETRIYKKRIRQSQTALESILDNTGIDIYVNDFYNHDILYVNRSMAAPYGGQKEFMGQKCWQVLFPGQTGPCDFCPQKQLIDEQGLPTKVYTWDYQRPFDGSWFRVFSAAFRWADGRLAHVVSSADITDNKRNEALIENLANYDQLTKLPNRRMLLKECERRIGKATETEQGYLLFFDIDGFKSINDNFGHDAGDEFLIQLGEFFSGIPLLKGAIYRNGGDEFVALIGGEGVTKTNILNLSNFIHERFKKPWALKKGNAFCSTSIGVACYPEDGKTAEELLQKADMAMYQAKKSGGGHLCFGYQLKAADNT